MLTASGEVLAVISDVSKRYKHPDPPKRGAWCFYCGKTQPWFWCECAEAMEARAGKRARPEYQRIDGKNVMVLEPSLLTRPWNKERLPVISMPSANTPANTGPVSSPVSTNGEDVSMAVSREEKRREYQRELMRRRRAKGNV